jgi:hypothetical protein
MSSGAENIFFTNISSGVNYWPAWCGLKDQSIVANQDSTGVFAPSVRIHSDTMSTTESNGIAAGSGAVDCKYTFTAPTAGSYFSGEFISVDEITPTEWLHYEVFWGVDDLGTMIYMQDNNGHTVAAGGTIKMQFDHPLDITAGDPVTVVMYRRTSADDVSLSYLQVEPGTTNPSEPYTKYELRTFTDEVVTHSGLVAPFNEMLGDETGLVLHVPFTEIGTDATQYDRSESAYTLTNFGSPVIAADYGQYGSGAYFNSANTTFLSTPDNLPTLAEWSLEVVFNAIDSTRTLLLASDEGGFSNDLLFGISPSTSSLPNKIGIEIQANGAYNNIDDTIDIVTGEWYHVVATYDGTTMHLIVNGEVKASLTETNLGISANTWGIGGRNEVGSYPFNGYMDYAKVYSRALSLEEVKAHHMRRGGNSVVKSDNFKVFDTANNLIAAIQSVVGGSQFVVQNKTPTDLVLYSMQASTGDHKLDTMYQETGDVVNLDADVVDFTVRNIKTGGDMSLATAGGALAYSDGTRDRVSVDATKTELVSADGGKLLSLNNAGRAEFIDTGDSFGASGLEFTNLQPSGFAGVQFVGETDTGYLGHFNSTNRGLFYDYGDAIEMGGGASGKHFFIIDFTIPDGQVVIGREESSNTHVVVDRYAFTVEAGVIDRLEIDATASKLSSPDGTNSVLVDNTAFAYNNGTYDLISATATGVQIKSQSGADNLWLDNNTLEYHDGTTTRIDVNADATWMLDQQGGGFKSFHNGTQATAYYAIHDSVRERLHIANAYTKFVSPDGGTDIQIENGRIECNSTTAGFMLPRMTTTQRDLLTSADGMMIYNTTTSVFNFYENGVWVAKANV